MTYKKAWSTFIGSTLFYFSPMSPVVDNTCEHQSFRSMRLLKLANMRYLGSISRSRFGWLYGAGLLLAQPGCFLLPTYHQPQGFSSTYYRHLQDAAQAQALAIPQSPPMSQPLVGAKSSPQDVPAVDEPAAQKSAGVWSWIRNPLTSRSSSEEAEDSADEPVLR